VIHLDTTFAVDLLRETRKGTAGDASRFLSSLNLGEVAISVFVQCELLFGAELSQRADESRAQIGWFCSKVNVVYPDERFPEIYGRVASALRRSGITVGTMDVLISVPALVAGVPLVTRNVKDFVRIPGLEVISY
jgi:predicted nucleic acid-binding protein